MSLLPLDPYAPGGQMNPDGHYQRHGRGALQDTVNRYKAKQGGVTLADLVAEYSATTPVPSSVMMDAARAAIPAAPPQAALPAQAAPSPMAAALATTPVPQTAPQDLASGISAVPAPDVSAMGQRKPKFFAKDGAWRDVVGTIGDLLGAASSPGGGYWAAKGRLRKQEHDEQLLRDTIARQQANRMQDRQWQVEDRDAKLNAPQYFMSGRDRVSFDPVSGDSQVIYDGPEDYESYAASLGLDPEADGNAYDSAVQDYVLRGNGPTSQAARRALEADRNLNRMNLRAMPTYAQANPRPRSGGGGGGRGRAPTMTGIMAPILGKVSRGEALTPGEQKAWSMYRPGRGPGGASGGRVGGGGSAAGVTRIAIGPNGQKVGWNGKAWVPVQ